MKRAIALAAAALLLVQPAYAVCAVTGADIGVGSRAAVVMEYESGRLLFAQSADERLPMASTTKIMTAWLALEQPGLFESFTVDSAAIMVEGSSMGLRTGDTATLYALAAGMLMSSGNDAANAAAVRISGSVEGFIGEMNARAAALGMENTAFATPSGLDSDGHYSTARDMALLARAALGNSFFRRLAAQKNARVSFGAPPYERVLYNHNKLLHYYPDAIGIKTGFTKKAGRCLVSAAQRDGVTLICVTLSCPDDWDTHEYLYDRYFRYVRREALAQLPPVEIPVVGGVYGSVRAAQTGEVYITAVENMPHAAESRVFCEKFIYAPVKAGDIVGRIVYYIDGKAVGESALAAQQPVDILPYTAPIPWWQFWRRS